MLSFLRGAPAPQLSPLPLFPLKTVLFPGGLLPLKVFEQRYIDMTKACLRDETPFGVCLLTKGPEVGTGPDATPLEIARIGTVARITGWDMPQLGILHLKTEGSGRFQVQAQSIAEDGLVTAEVTPIEPEDTLPLPDHYRPLADLLKILIDRLGAENFPAELALDDASWVSYRLAEILPLPLPIKQTMLEVNDCQVRLQVLAKFLKQQELI